MMTLRSTDGPYNGLQAKIDFIQECYRKSVLTPGLRERFEAVAGRGTRLEQARRLFDWIRARVDYSSDPVGFERTKSPAVIVSEVERRGRSSGDCDDQACLAYSALQLMGIPSRLRVIWLSKPMPVHIYVVAYVDGQEVPFDTTRERGFGPGSEVAYSRKEDY